MREGGVDVAAACQVAIGWGCDAAAAPALVLAVNAGFWRGWRKRNPEKED